MVREDSSAHRTTTTSTMPVNFSGSSAVGRSLPCRAGRDRHAGPQIGGLLTLQARYSKTEQPNVHFSTFSAKAPTFLVWCEKKYRPVAAAPPPHRELKMENSTINNI